LGDMPTLTVKKAYRAAVERLCAKLKKAKGHVVSMSARELCGEENPKPCGEALKQLCIAAGEHCYKASKRKYVFDRNVVNSLNICRDNDAYAGVAGA